MCNNKKVTIEEFESQLQSQYLANKSSTFSSYATLIVAALAIIGVFGKVLIGTGSGSCNEYSLSSSLLSALFIFLVSFYTSVST